MTKAGIIDWIQVVSLPFVPTDVAFANAPNSMDFDRKWKNAKKGNKTWPEIKINAEKAGRNGKPLEHPIFNVSLLNIHSHFFLCFQ